MVAIGIDLGTTYIAVGVYQNGKVEIIANDQGIELPLHMLHLQNQKGYWRCAKNQAGANPTNTVFDANV